jgi:hypothetical protein
MYFKKIFSFLSTKKYYVSVCCIVKDENEYLNEWISYYLKIGVEHFYIYDNGSAIAVEETLQKLDLLRYCTVMPIAGTSQQNAAYKHCIKNYKNKSKWIGFFDVDEFLVPKSTKGNLPEFLKDYEAYGGLGINWLVFGSSGLKEKSNRPQLETFTWRSELDFSVNRHIKTIVQPKLVKNVVNPHSFRYKKGYCCVNENFEVIDGAFSPPSVNKIQLNHYYCRSLEEYYDKIKRGRADDGLISRKLDDFHKHDALSNAVRDIEICDLIDQLK